MSDKQSQDEEYDSDTAFAIYHQRWREALIKKGVAVGPRYRRTLAFWLFERGLFGTICLHNFVGLFWGTFVFVFAANDDAPRSLQPYTTGWRGLGWILEHAGNPHFAFARQCFWWVIWGFNFRLLGVIWLRYVGTIKMDKYRLTDDDK